MVPTPFPETRAPGLPRPIATANYSQAMHPAISSVAAPVNRDGWPFVLLAAVVAVLAWLLWQPLFWPFAALAAWVAYFFRDPARVTPTRAGLVTSAADGKIMMIRSVPPPPELDMGSEPRP